MSETATEYLIRFHPGKCIRCYGCETACKSWRALPYGVRHRRVLTLWRGRYPEVTSVPLSLSCLHCVAPACAQACPEEAIAKDPATGRVELDAGRCIGCEACAEACPYGVPRFGEERIMQKCDLCLDTPPAGMAPPCVETCPGGALERVAVSVAEKKAEEAAVAGMLGGAAEGTDGGS